MTTQETIAALAAEPNCRSCDKVLQITPSGLVHNNGKDVLRHYYGGYVCSESCDIVAWRDMQLCNVWSSNDEARMRESLKFWGARR